MILNSWFIYEYSTKRSWFKTGCLDRFGDDASLNGDLAGLCPGWNADTGTSKSWSYARVKDLPIFFREGTGLASPPHGKRSWNFQYPTCETHQINLFSLLQLHCLWFLEILSSETTFSTCSRKWNLVFHQDERGAVYPATRECEGVWGSNCFLDFHQIFLSLLPHPDVASAMQS